MYKCIERIQKIDTLKIKNYRKLNAFILMKTISIGKIQ